MKKIFKQHIENLPKEILCLMRFFPATILPDGKKKPLIDKWNDPKFQSFADDAYQHAKAICSVTPPFAAFDTSGHGKGADYALIDLDHVRDATTGEITYPDAEKWINYLKSEFEGCYCELSQSQSGFHFLCRPTVGKFDVIKNTKRAGGVLVFDEEKGAKLEISYKMDNKSCHLTGNLFECEPNAPILAGEVADGVIEQILRAIQSKSPKKEKSATPRADGQTLPAEIQELADRINDITPDELTAKGYLRHSENGDPEPNGYICPWCGSGTHASKTGALTYYDTPEPHFTCHAQGCGGDVIKFLSEIYGIDNHGKAFYELLRRAADDFNIAYAPKIFERKTPAQDSATVNEPAATDSVSASQAEQFTTGDDVLDDDIRAQLKIWQEFHGEINPAVIEEIFDAVAYVSKLKADNFKREDAYNLVVRRRIALLKYYAEEFAFKFFDFLRGVKVTDIRDIKSEIAKLAKRVEERQKQFKQDKAAADTEKKRKARAFAVSNNIEELQRLHNEPPSTDRDYKMRDLIRETVDWQLDRHGDRVAVKATADNLHKIFTFDPALDGLFGYEQFVEADVFLKPPPWNPEKQRGDEWNDRDDAQLRMYLRTEYADFKDKDLILDGVTQYSDKRAFHPIKDFFRNLPTWDNQLRAERIFCKYLGAEDNSFNREVTLNWLLAAVARIFHSGCNYQLCPILKGAQGIGKSFIIETLGGQWYSALNHDVNSEQAFEVLRNSWLIEFKELKAMRKADVNSIKAFIDTAADNRREKYGRRAKIFKRHCVTIATTNDEQFLSDVTGNRRFPIIECFNPRGQHGEQPTPEEIAQIWAEVFHRYCEMFNGKFDAAGVFSDEFDDHKLNLSEAAKPIVEELAEQHMRDDGLQGEVQSFLDKPIPADVIWNLLTKDERRKFFADEKITIEHDALHARFYPANKNRQPAEELRAAYEAAIKPSNFVKRCTIRTPFGDVDALTFYGTEQRQHICAAEILNEAFANSDRRVSMRRIIEVLSQLEGWTQGKRIKSYSAYGDQRNIFYRDADNQPTEPPADNTDYDFGGEPIDNFDVPDFKKDRVED